MADVEQELREAFELMKAGDKREAGNIVQAALKKDKENPNAWWMMANILEDEDKIIRCLENVLKFKPDHKGALAMMKKYNHQYISDEPPAALEAFNWSKLGEVDLEKEKAANPNEQKVVLLATATLLILGVLIALLAAGNYFLVSPEVPAEIVAQDIFSATVRFDTATLASKTCEEYRDALVATITSARESLFAEYGSLLPNWFDRTTAVFQVDMSKLNFVAQNRVLREIDVRVSGDYVLSLDGLRGFAPSFTIDDTAHFIIENEQWVFCEPPN